jgi:hypothetical protein
VGSALSGARTGIIQRRAVLHPGCRPSSAPGLPAARRHS